MFFPGETITHKFIVPFSKSEIDHAVISYKQNGGIVFEVTITTFEKVENSKCSVTYNFTQEDSLLFEDDMPFTIQCNIYTKQGTRHTSHEMSSSSGVQYLREVMT